MRPFVIGIAGGTGSGKTTVVQELAARLGRGRASVIEHDSYYLADPSLSYEERSRINYDHPAALETTLLIRHLDQLRSSHAVEIPVYDFTQHLRRAETRRVEPCGVIIVEGILVLCDPELRQRMDLRIFVETDDDVRFIRRLQRDLKERGRTVESVIRQYLSTVKPMHLEFALPSRRHAQLIIPGEGDITTVVDVIIAGIRAAAPMLEEPAKPG